MPIRLEMTGHELGEVNMPKMCSFIVSGGDAPVFINPTLVRMLRPGPGYTSIQFDKEHSVSVDLPIEEVQIALDQAMNSG
jgi:hypothetical protein